ncbi:cytosine permease, partial [Rhodococcus sp. NPDC057014]
AGIMLVHYFRVEKRQIDARRLFDPIGSRRLPDVNWTTMGCFVAGIAATWLFMYGATSLTQGFAARALGGLDLSWLAGGGVAATLYSVLGPRAHRPYRITGQSPTRSAATTDSPDVLTGN